MKLSILFAVCLLVGCGGERAHSPAPVDTELLSEWAIYDPFDGTGWSVVFEPNNRFSGHEFDLRKWPKRGTLIFAGRYEIPASNEILFTPGKDLVLHPIAPQPGKYNYRISTSNFGTDDQPQMVELLECDAFPDCGVSYWLMRMDPPMSNEAGAGQSATFEDSKSEGNANPEPVSEGEFQ